MTEKEIKVLLTREQYEKVKGIFRWGEQIFQVNHYYVNSDTEDEKRLSIRVREENSRFWLQIKRPKTEENALHISEEYQRELDSVPDRLDSETLTELTGFYVPDSRLLGTIYTERAVCKSYPGLEICLDRIRYGEVTEFELELEYRDEWPGEAVKVLEENGIRFGEKVFGKYYRFLRYVRERGITEENGE